MVATHLKWDVLAEQHATDLPIRVTVQACTPEGECDFFCGRQRTLALQASHKFAPPSILSSASVCCGHEHAQYICQLKPTRSNLARAYQAISTPPNQANFPCSFASLCATTRLHRRRSTRGQPLMTHERQTDLAATSLRRALLKATLAVHTACKSPGASEMQKWIETGQRFVLLFLSFSICFAFSIVIDIPASVSLFLAMSYGTRINMQGAKRNMGSIRPSRVSFNVKTNSAEHETGVLFLTDASDRV